MREEVYPRIRFPLEKFVSSPGLQRGRSRLPLLVCLHDNELSSMRVLSVSVILEDGARVEVKLEA